MNKRVVSLGVVGALILAAVVPAGAAPVLSSTAQVGSALASDARGQVTEVRWRGGAIAAGVGAGLALGALAASQPSYYGYGGYYDPYYYGGPAYYGGYYAPSYSYGYQGYAPYYYHQGRRDTNASNNW